MWIEKILWSLQPSESCFLKLCTLLLECSDYFRLLSSRSYFVISLTRAGIVNLNIVAAGRRFLGKCLKFSIQFHCWNSACGNPGKRCCLLHVSLSSVMFSGNISFIQINFKRQLIPFIYHTFILLSDGFQGEPEVFCKYVLLGKKFMI